MAYIDPGSGSLLWQMLLAGIVGFAFHFRQAMHALFSGWLGKRRSGDVSPPEAPTEPRR